MGALLLKPLNPLSRKRFARKNMNLLLNSENSKTLEIKIVHKSEETEALKGEKITQKVEEVENHAPKHQRLCSKLCQRLVQAMDLELLCDPAFWSIIIGMALVYTSTINFTLIFPSFLKVCCI